MNVSSQRPVTYLVALKEFAERGTNKSALPIRWRPNTDIILAEDERDGRGLGTRQRFDVLLYGNRIASLYHDGVKVYMPRVSNTSKNRINDVLIPLGWRLRQTDGDLVLSHRDGHRVLRFVSGMTVTNN